jgi:hypothetical protein
MYINSKLKSKRKANYFNYFLIALITVYQALKKVSRFFLIYNIKINLKSRRIFINLDQLCNFYNLESTKTKMDINSTSQIKS